MSYDPKSKPGNLRLWSSYSGSVLRPDPIKNSDDALLEFMAFLFGSSSIYKNIHVDFAIGNDNDVFSILAAIKMVGAGKDYSFKNYAGRVVSFSRMKAEHEMHEVVLVKIHHKTEVGIMTLKEIDELKTITRRILANLKYSAQEIAEKVEQLIVQSTIQDDEDSKKIA